MNDPNPTCDPELIADLVRSQADTALDTIAHCYLGYLLGVGRCACRDADGAKDAVHDALIAAAERLDQFRGDGTVKAWLSRMVVNACLCQRRGRKNDPAWNQPLVQEPMTAHEDPEDHAARAELVAHLDEALAHLRADDHSLFLLSQVEGIAAPELARVFEISPDAVRARLTRIRRSLRAELEPVWREWA